MSNLESELIVEVLKRDLAKASPQELRGHILRVWDLYQKERSHSQFLADKLDQSSEFWYRLCLALTLVAATAVFVVVFGV